MEKSEESLRDLWDNTKMSNIRVIGVLEGEEKGRSRGKFEEIVMQIFQM